MDFEELYSACFRKVYRFALSLCRSPNEAEEIAQETFFRAMEKIGSLPEDASVEAWLLRIAHNLFISSRRKKKRIDPYAEIEMLPAEDGLEDKLSDEAQAGQILRHLHELDEPYKEVFTLRALGDVPYAKIASLFGKGENWARVVHFRARKQLLERMDEEEKK